jgi:hypothetical protein
MSSILRSELRPDHSIFLLSGAPLASSLPPQPLLALSLPPLLTLSPPLLVSHHCRLLPHRTVASACTIVASGRAAPFPLLALRKKMKASGRLNPLERLTA